MGFEDKAKNKIDEIGGKVKEAVGKVTGDERTENEGKLDPDEVQPQRRRREDQGRLQREVSTAAPGDSGDA